MFPSHCQAALKEWAVVVRALGQGDQILLLRKGGISEVGKHFKVAYPEFLLYPTLEHQKPELLKEDNQQHLRDLLAQGQDTSNISFAHWAKTEDVIELSEEEQLGLLSPHHIWSENYAQSRLRWKPRHPLSAMLLRVYRMETPVSVPYQAYFGGCKSWVELGQDVALGDLTPVLGDAAFSAQVDAIKGVLETVANPAA